MSAATYATDRETYLARVRARLRGEPEPRAERPRDPIPPVAEPHWASDAAIPLTRPDHSVSLEPAPSYARALETFASTAASRELVALLPELDAGDVEALLAVARRLAR